MKIGLKQNSKASSFGSKCKIDRRELLQCRERGMKDSALAKEMGISCAVYKKLKEEIGNRYKL